MNDPELQQMLETLPLNIIEKDGFPAILIEKEETHETYSPEEITAMIFRKLKGNAEAFLHQDVARAVIAAPVYFGESERSSLKAACEASNLGVLEIIEEPIAAAIAYNLQRQVEEEQRFLVFDLGGSTFDVSVLSLAAGKLRVLSSLHDPHMGGRSFDLVLVDFFAKEFQRNFKMDLKESKRLVVAFSSFLLFPNVQLIPP